MKALIKKATDMTQRSAVAMQLNCPKFRRQRGASAIEYVVIAALIAVAFFAIAAVVGGDIGDTFEKISDALQKAIGTAAPET